MKNIFLLALIIPMVSACGLVGAAVNVTTSTVGAATKIITKPVDLIFGANEVGNPEEDIAMAYMPTP